MPEIQITLPKLHRGQQTVVNGAKRFNVLECGRRFGKTTLGIDVVVNTALDANPAGWFSPSYKLLSEVWRDTNKILAPLNPKISVQEHRIELITGGTIEFWSLDQADAGRSRKFKQVVIDEAGLVRNLSSAWQEAIRPTLADLKGGAWFLGTPKGRGDFHRLFARGESGDVGWASWRLPTTSNPTIDPQEIEDARRDMPDSAFKQEFLGIPADDGGCPFDLSAIRDCTVNELSTDPAVSYGVDLAKSFDWTWAIGLDDLCRVSFSDRWQSDWGQTRRRLVRILRHTPTSADSTGVGDPIVEDLMKECNGVEGFKFTAQTKQQLMEGLAASIQQREIRFPKGPLVAELESFEYEYYKGGVRYSAPQGMHDDGVCALALALHCYKERTNRARVASFRPSAYSISK
jgi:hypothetical protein